MKSVIIAHIVFLSVITAVIINSSICANLVLQTEQHIESIPSKCEMLDEFNDAFEEYMDKQRYIGLTVSHEDLSLIEDCFRELIGAAKANDEESLIIIQNRLIGALRHMRRLCGINTDSIF